ncbi:Putative acetyltransferase EpsM [Caulifigura coniformis]|uniref:Acetyltransferase EpsM n=1 Tax=Caulifigura coniformis TaxID=2527983 RepID=A0A517SB82_9PLAN|nr:acetyltransferase [Caulifigura coniformis]QDT53336.1 Putative acetyltransferase EpsM [Caulifigura coniformis]
MTKSLVICGAGGHAKVVADVARSAGWTVAGFVDDLHPERAGEAFFGSQILDANQVFQGSMPAIALGIGDCAARLRRATELLDLGCPAPVLVHPRAIVASSAQVGPGTQVIAGAVLNPDARLGTAVIINTGATVDHDCVIGDGVHLAPGVHLAGNVTVGERTLIGIGSVVKPGIRIGRDCVIGAGSVVVEDLPDGAIAYGVPARIQRNR